MYRCTENFSVTLIYKNNVKTCNFFLSSNYNLIYYKKNYIVIYNNLVFIIYNWALSSKKYRCGL